MGCRQLRWTGEGRWAPPLLHNDAGGWATPSSASRHRTPVPPSVGTRSHQAAGPGSAGPALFRAPGPRACHSASCPSWSCSCPPCPSEPQRTTHDVSAGCSLPATLISDPRRLRTHSTPQDAQACSGLPPSQLKAAFPCPQDHPPAAWPSPGHACPPWLLLSSPGQLLR